MKLTVAVLHCIGLLFYLPRQLSTSNFSSILPMQPLTGQIVTLKNVFTRNLATKITSSVNWLPLWPTFPQLVCLFKTLFNQVAFNLAIYWLLGEFKGNLCTAVTLHITATRPFPKGDRYIQVRLYIVYWMLPTPTKNLWASAEDSGIILRQKCAHLYRYVLQASSWSLVSKCE